VSEPPAQPSPILVDCDTGIDDSLALLYAAASPDCELVAVTCTAGNVALPQVAENTRAVLELAGRPDVEVAVGREKPLQRALVTTPETHGPRGIGYAELPPARMPLSPRPGSELIVEEARRRPGELTLVTLAPLTNVALALRAEPRLPALLRRMVVMGGSYRSPGNTAPTTEWNVSCDPEAVKEVFDAFARAAAGASGAPEGSAGPGGSTGPDGSIQTERLAGPEGSAGPEGPSRPEGSIGPEGSPRPIVLGLDVTERAKFTPEHMARLAARAGCAPDGRRADGSWDPVIRYVADALRFYMEFHSRFDGFYGAYVHDPLALATALDPSLVRTEPVAVDVELAGSLTAGETVADWRRRWGRPANVAVAVAADADRFFEQFIERVGGLAARLGGG
jgi:purine nucleosidase